MIFHEVDMYRIDDRSSAIAELQKYLDKIGISDVFIAPSGIYDETTREAVVQFQKSKHINPSGIVDLETYNLIYSEYLAVNEREQINSRLGSSISFPIYEGSYFPKMAHINRAMAECLDYYGYSHSLRDSSYYSSETAAWVKELRKIYMLPDRDNIDTEFYSRLMKDRDSIEEFSKL